MSPDAASSRSMSQPTIVPGMPGHRNLAMQNSPSDRAQDLPVWPGSQQSGGVQPYAVQSPASPGQFVSSNDGNIPEIMQGRYPTPAPSDNYSTGTYGTQQYSGQQYSGQQYSGHGYPASGSSMAAKVKMVNSSRFQIDYRLEDVGPSGISSVELFITADGGQQWWRYGEDPDRVSPFEVEVPKDGQYGFAIRAKSGVGSAAMPPRQGDQPAIRVLVDQTAPQVESLTAQQGQQQFMNQITLNWKVADAMLMERPISLSYAGNPEGPWEPLTGWNEDTGQYVWTVNQGTPNQLYFRLTARDAAGNIAYRQTQYPVLIDLSLPRAQILDIESLPMQRPY